VPWPAGDPDGAFLELRRGLWLPGQNIELDRRRQVPLFAIEDVARLPAELVVADTEPLVAGLLHVEFSFWSQYTRSFDSRSPEDGPEWVWDSARAGLLTAGDDPRRQFSLDLGPESLDDTTDDVFPRMVRATLVVARHGRVARLAASLAPSATELQLLTTRPLPDLETTEYLKVGGEWVRHGGVRGNVLRGLTRGVRGTVARAHARGTAVRAGKKIVVLVPVLYGRDSWNG